MPLNVRPITPAIGAIIDGVDLQKPLSGENKAAINDALLAHQVIFFRGQPLTPTQQRDFAASFGDLHIHPIYPTTSEQKEILIIDTHADSLPDNDNWHIDVTFIETPPLGSILQAIQLPAKGGDTLWASSAAAFEALSAPLQEFLEGLTATHDIGKSFPAERYATTAEARATWEQALAKNPPIIHPVIRSHPESGRKSLLVNEGFTTRINELSKKESDLLLGYLFSHVSQPEFTLRWHWQLGDIAFWDNRITQHYAVADYLPERRVMHRATVLGDKPFINRKR